MAMHLFSQVRFRSEKLPSCSSRLAEAPPLTCRLSNFSQHACHAPDFELEGGWDMHDPSWPDIFPTGRRGLAPRQPPRVYFPESFPPKISRACGMPSGSHREVAIWGGPAEGKPLQSVYGRIVA